MGDVLSRPLRFYPVGLVALALGAALLPGCPFSTFEVVSSSPAPNAGSGGTGIGGSVSVGGGSSTGQGGSPSKATPPRAHADRYFMLQGRSLSVRSPGVLENDSPRELEVDVGSATGSNGVLDDFVMSWKLGPDGSFEFEPDKRFVGVYEITYEVRNRDGVVGASKLEVNVLPDQVDLNLVGRGVGGVVLEGSRGDRLGQAMERGDVNGDGVDDLLLGAPGADLDTGAAFVVFGGRDVSSLDLSSSSEPDDASLYAVLNGEARGDALGSSLSTLRTAAGRTTALLLGAPGGFGRVEVHTLRAFQDKSSPAFEIEHRYAVRGNELESGVGGLVACAGDVNGDQLPDLLLGSRIGERGALRVVFGAELPPEDETLADAGGLTLLAQNDGEAFPLAFANVGDLDQDGATEVLAASTSNFILLKGGGAYPASEAEVSIDGSAYGWRATRAAPGAPASVAALADSDSDGVPDLGYCDGNVGCRVVRGPISTLLSGFRVSGFGEAATRLGVVAAGDVDADGIEDLAFAEDTMAYVVYRRHAAEPDVNVSALSAGGFSLRMPEGRSVSAIASAGDWNDDGVDDLAISDTSFRSSAGRVYVVFGVASR
jgi:hypothetical protein